MTVNITNFSRIDEINAKQWNALVRDGYPFLQHEVLAAMEQCECVGEHCGWIPRHLGCFDDGELIGAMPLYEKHNSWGEFVFDHVWAEAFHRAGINYYPKLVNAIPFTPARGQRLLVKDSARKEITQALLNGARELMQHGQFSGLHSLFTIPDEFKLLNTDEAVCRTDCQFHWHNCDYQDFAQFLATLKAKKRKNICREREKVRQSGVVIRRLDGYTATQQDWHDFDELYRGIYDRKYGHPAFNQPFFMKVAAAIPEQIILLMAYRNEQPIATALMYKDRHTLYGRYWGCSEYLDSLHFELCYYQGIEICIELGLQHFDPGAQGEHKIARGFSPTRTRSLHWMADSRVVSGIQQFAQHEKAHVAQYMDAVKAHSPYQQNHADDIHDAHP